MATVLAVAVALTVALMAAQPAAGIAPARQAPPAAPAPAAPPGPGHTIEPRLRDQVLPPGWRASGDLAWTTTGDANGLHVLTASAGDGYTWKTVTTLSEPGFEVDQWIGNACLTGSGRRLVVVYGPRTYTNNADLFDRGGFGAVVDLRTGAVAKLPVRSSLAYFNPGCGAGETATLTQLAGERADGPAAAPESRVLVVDAAAGTVSAPILVRAEITAAVPVGGTVVAAGARHLLRVDRDGRLHRLVPTAGVPFRLTPDADGGLVFLEREGGQVRARRVAPGSPMAASLLAVGPTTELGLARGRGGLVFLTGRKDRVGPLPRAVRSVAAPGGSSLSSDGGIAVTRVRNAGPGDPRVAPSPPDEARDVRIEATVPGTGKAVTFGVTPAVEGADGGSGRAAAPVGARTARAPRAAARAAATAATEGDPTSAVELERTCSVPRNDPHNQAMQPKPRQVEWAIDQAITDSLHLTRDANWKNLDMPAYSPQGLFPSIPLLGGGRVPAQIMLGVAAQESNLWEASRYALPGVTGNPLIGNYYGLQIYNDDPSDDWDIHWADADCGYGVMQVTDGMRRAGKERPGDVAALPYETQRAVALDFAANVAAGLRILQAKWNETRAAGLVVNNGDPASIENWFYAAWAYNSGFHADKGDGTPWGVGWGNNPINPRFDPQREPFMEDYADAKTPQKWPYPEKIMGWAGHPPELNESPTDVVTGYRAAWWSSTLSRRFAKPPLDEFCDPSNDCYPGGSFTPNDPDVIGEPPGPCAHQNAAGKYDLRCWYHLPAAWKGGPGLSCDCGNEVLRFDPGYEYQADGDSFPPDCDLSGLPNGSYVIDDLLDGTPSIRSNCGRPWTNAGSFSLRFAADDSGNYPSKVDFHQLGGGFGGHFYSSFTNKQGYLGGKMQVTGTWTIWPTSAWTRVLVHVPDQGSYTRQADYKIYLPGRTMPKHRSIPTRWQQNKWLDLGVFDFRAAGFPKVTLSNVSEDGIGIHKVIWDAIAVQPLPAKPRHFVVAMGDSFSSGEGGGDYTRVSDQYNDDEFGGPDRPFKNSCRRGANAWSRKVVIPGTPGNAPLGGLSDSLDPNVDFHHIACSGAQTFHVMATRTSTGQPAPPDAAKEVPRDTTNGELTQIDQGFLDENTTLVLLSIGGNDANWAAVSQACGWDDCMAPGYTLPGDDRPMVESVPAKLRNEVKPDVQRVIDEIRERARDAWIVLVGYPQLFKSGTTYDANPLPGVAFGLTGPEVAWLNDMARIAATEVLASVVGNKVSAIDVRADFAGHELGTADVSENWLNGYILGDAFRPDDDDGEPNDSRFGFGSFHPNPSGYRAYGNAVSSRLSVLSYRWS